MRISKRAVAALVGVGAIAIASMAIAVSTSGADPGNQGDHGGDGNGAPLLKATLAPSLLSDPDVHGVARGGAPWVLQRGDVRLKSDGTFDLRVQGLVIPTMGNPGPVNTIDASLYCAPDTGPGSDAVATTQSVPISRSGDARIQDTIRVPPTCLAPVILVHPNGNPTAYIAVTGWRS
jgi:hypothetical protein